MIKKILFFIFCAFSFCMLPMQEDISQLIEEAAAYDAEVAQRGHEKPKPLKMAKDEPEYYYVIPPTHNNRSACDQVCCFCVEHTAGCLAEICAWLHTISNSEEKND